MTVGIDKVSSPNFPEHSIISKIIPDRQDVTAGLDCEIVSVSLGVSNNKSAFRRQGGSRWSIRKSF